MPLKFPYFFLGTLPLCKGWWLIFISISSTVTNRLVVGYASGPDGAQHACRVTEGRCRVKVKRKWKWEEGLEWKWKWEENGSDRKDWNECGIVSEGLNCKWWMIEWSSIRSRQVTADASFGCWSNAPLEWNRTRNDEFQYCFLWMHFFWKSSLKLASEIIGGNS